MTIRGPILLTGGSGQLGGELSRMFAGARDVHVPNRDEMDLSDADSVRRMVRRVRPRWIVNAGAYTAVDKAEQEPDLAYAINRDAPGVLGAEAVQVGAVVVHFSTDYVFDGLGTRPYLETDSTGPAGVYGASKLAGEKALQESGAKHLIFRTSWVYGAAGKNFLKTILGLARQRESINVVNDQHGAPTWSRDLASMTIAVMQQCEFEAGGGELANALKSLGGIYHAAGGGETTWHGFAQEAVSAMKRREPEIRWADIAGITTAQFGAAAKRPANSRLDCGKLQGCFGWRMMDWRTSLAEVLAEL